jgi:hypothetical protein
MRSGKSLKGTTIFLGCGFAAKYLHGGGNFSVPLQWMLGLKRLGLDAIWLEWMPTTKNSQEDLRHIQTFVRRLRAFGLDRQYCLLLQDPAQEGHELEKMKCYGLTRKKLLQRLRGPNILLNLSHSIRPPFIHQFERRIYCDIDPGEISYWMSKLEMGQSYHHEFCTIGLNRYGKDCAAPQTSVKWKTFYPLVDTEMYKPQPHPKQPRFTTITQWYWHQGIEINGEYPDLSKRAAFEKYLNLPEHIKDAELELAINLNPDDPEIDRIQKHGWKLATPHRVASSPAKYRKYIASATAEFTACKGVDCLWKTGWLSDRAAAFLASGRPVITEDTGAKKYLPNESGFLWVSNLEEAKDAVQNVLKNWKPLSTQARSCALELFDSAKNLQNILSFS